MKKSNQKAKALKDIVGRAMMARAAQGAPATPMGMGMKKGGSYRKAADGPVVKKGKTKGKEIRMAGGGMKGCK
jgi:hypothetical protein